MNDKELTGNKALDLQFLLQRLSSITTSALTPVSPNDLDQSDVFLNMREYAIASSENFGGKIFTYGIGPCVGLVLEAKMEGEAGIIYCAAHFAPIDSLTLYEAIDHARSVIKKVLKTDSPQCIDITCNLYTSTESDEYLKNILIKTVQGQFHQNKVTITENCVATGSQRFCLNVRTGCIVTEVTEDLIQQSEFIDHMDKKKVVCAVNKFGNINKNSRLLLPDYG